MIVQIPNPVLTQKSRPVLKIDKKINSIIAELKKTLKDTKNPKGVGLAAPQIGVSLRIFVIRPKEKDPISVFINPEILWQSSEKDIIRRPEKKDKGLKEDNRLEGCLSLNNVWGHVKRPIKVKLRFLSLDGKMHEKEFSGFESTIVQHETDHLDGILFPMRVLEQKGKLFSVEEKDGKEKLVEMEI